MFLADLEEPGEAIAPGTRSTLGPISAKSWLGRPALLNSSHLLDQLLHQQMNRNYGRAGLSPAISVPPALPDWLNPLL
jgi:hypothetical protein